MIMTMIMVNIFEAKAKLSEYVEAAERGERVLICKRNRPVAELRPVEQTDRKPRDLTPLYPDWRISPKCFEPLPQEELDAWYGGDPTAVAERAAGRRPSYGRQSGKRKRR